MLLNILFYLSYTELRRLSAGLMLGLLAVTTLQLVTGVHAVNELIAQSAGLYAVASVLMNHERGDNELL